MTPTLADISFGEVVTMLSRVEDAIRRVQLPTASECHAGAVDQLAALVTLEQILADELEVRRNGIRKMSAASARRREDALAAG